MNHTNSNDGLVVYGETKDTTGADIIVQESSAATVDAVWIFAKREGESVSAHLDVEQARTISEALDRFINAYKP